MRRLLTRLESTSQYVWMRQWLATHSFPGLDGIPLLDVMIFFRQELKREGLTLRANAMAFSFFLSLFPSIIFLITLLPYLPIEDIVQTMKSSVIQILPVETATYINSTIDQLTLIPRGGLLSVGLLLTLYFASNGMMSMLRGFEKQYEDTFRHRSGLRRRFVALQLTLILGVLLISSLVFIVLGRTVLNGLLTWAHIGYSEYYIILILRWIAIFLLFYSGISILYRYGPAMKRRMRFFSPGATVATLLSLLSSFIFAYYVNQFNTYNKIYGSLGALIVLMLWLQINSMVILIGYELNASIAVNKAIRRRRRKEEAGKV